MPAQASLTVTGGQRACGPESIKTREEPQTGGIGSSGQQQKLCNVLGALTLCNSAASVLGEEDPFVCPITHEVMTDPVVANDGFSYERTAFTKWLADGKRTSPKTGLYLLVTSVLPNHALRRAIEQHHAKGREQGATSSVSSRGSGRGSAEQDEDEEEQGAGGGAEEGEEAGDDACRTGRTAVELAEDTLRESPCPLPAQQQPSSQTSVWASKVVGVSRQSSPFQFSAPAFSRPTSSPHQASLLSRPLPPSPATTSPATSSSLPHERSSLLELIDDVHDNVYLTPGNPMLLAAGASPDDSNDACAALVGLLRVYLNDRLIVRSTLLALGRLTFAKGEGPHAVHRRRLGALGACEATVDVLKRYQISPETTEAAMVLLCQLAREDCQRTPQEAEAACDMVVSIMRAFPRDSSILRAACGCVWNLSATNTFNTRRLGFAGACEQVLMAMQAFINDVELFRTGCGAVLNLAMDGENSRRLGESGACELVLSCMRMLPNDAIMADNGCAALCNLSCQNEDNKRRLRAGGAIGLLQAVRNGWAREPAIQRSSAQALINLQQISPSSPSIAPAMVL